MKNLKIIIGSLAMLLTLNACAPALIAGGVGAGALGVNERRTSGVLVEDQSIEVKAQHKIKDYPDRQKAHVSVLSYNQRVLLTGEVPSRDFGLRAERDIRSVEHVRDVINELIISEPASVSSISNDALITSKVKTALTAQIKKKGFNSAHVKVKTERGIVYLMGIVTREEADIAVNIVRGVSGVAEIVPLFEIQ